MTGMSSEDKDPVAWLRKAIEQRLALAREACEETSGHWWRRTDERGEPVSHLWAGEPIRDQDGDVWAGGDIVVYDEGRPSDLQFDHIAANDPQDTIARCEAELAILDEHYILYRGDTDEAYAEFSVCYPPGIPGLNCGCTTCHYKGFGGVEEYGICRTVKYVASGYQRAPGYREEDWKPGVRPWKAPKRNLGSQNAQVRKSASRPVKLQIVDGDLQDLHVILKHAESAVAVHAKQATTASAARLVLRAARMIVIHPEHLGPLAADGAAAFLVLGD